VRRDVSHLSYGKQTERTETDHGSTEGRGARFFRPAHCQLTQVAAPMTMTCGCHITSHVDHLSDSAFPTRSTSTGITGITLGVLRTDNTEWQYMRAKVTIWSRVRIRDAQRNFSKKDPIQEVQNFRPGQDDRHADARVRLFRVPQMANND
jgi:hypothetical protein